jgi:addiction module RelE/StbE family toxin
MAEVIWAPTALDDIESIAEYIARDSGDMASIFVKRLFEATDRLKEFPLSGRIIPEINKPDCREILYGSYRIMYHLDNNNVWITGVIHGARDWKP